MGDDGTNGHIFEEHKSEEAQCPVTYAAGPIAALQWDLNHVGCSNEAGVRNYCFVVLKISEGNLLPFGQE